MFHNFSNGFCFGSKYRMRWTTTTATLRLTTPRRLRTLFCRLTQTRTRTQTPTTSCQSWLLSRRWLRFLTEETKIHPRRQRLSSKQITSNLYQRSWGLNLHLSLLCVMKRFLTALHCHFWTFIAFNLCDFQISPSNIFFRTEGETSAGEDFEMQSSSPPAQKMATVEFKLVEDLRLVSNRKLFYNVHCFAHFFAFSTTGLSLFVNGWIRQIF